MKDQFYISKSGEIFIRRNGEDILCADQDQAAKLLVRHNTDGNLLWTPESSTLPFPSEQYEVEVKEGTTCKNCGNFCCLSMLCADPDGTHVGYERIAVIKVRNKDEEPEGIELPEIPALEDSKQEERQRLLWWSVLQVLDDMNQSEKRAVPVLMNQFTIYDKIFTPRKKEYCDGLFYCSNDNNDVCKQCGKPKKEPVLNEGKGESQRELFRQVIEIFNSQHAVYGRPDYEMLLDEFTITRKPYT